MTTQNSLDAARPLVQEQVVPLLRISDARQRNERLAHVAGQLFLLGGARELLELAQKEGVKIEARVLRELPPQPP